MKFLHATCLASVAFLAFFTPHTLQSASPKRHLGHFRLTDLFKERKFQKVAIKDKTRFTQAEKDLIVEIHNAYRSAVEPPATDMREMTWSNELEEYAYNLTQSCTGAHSARTMVLTTGGHPQTLTNMGESLYYSYAPDYSIQEGLHLFWIEGKDYDIETDTCTHKDTCAHYITIVTAHNTQIGCAINTCKHFSVSKYPTPANFMACAYDGSWPGGRPYTVGERCSDCTRAKLGYNAQFCRNGLCVSPALYYTKRGYDGDVSVIDLKDEDRQLGQDPWSWKKKSPPGQAKKKTSRTDK